MGAWGSESYSNDSCWDHLFCSDIHNCTEKEIDNSLKNCLPKATSDSARNREVFLGVVVWGLTHSTKVSIDYLESALSIAEGLLRDADYLSDWRSSDERMNCILGEIKIIRYALKHEGSPPHMAKTVKKVDIAKLRKDLERDVGSESGLREDHLQLSDEELIAEFTYVYGEEAIKSYLT